MLGVMIVFCLGMGAGAGWAQGGPAPPAATADHPLSIVNNGDFTRDLAGNWGPNGGQPGVSVVAAQVGEYTRAVRVESAPVAGGQCWDVGFGQLITAPVRKGEAVYFRAWMRSPDRVRVSFILESLSEFTKVIAQEVRLTPEWQEYRFMGRAFRDLAPGGAQAKWWLGYDPGVVEIAGVRVEDYGMAPDQQFDQTFDYWGGREHSDAWRAAALARIEQLRQGDLTIRVLDAAGRPVPQAQVKVEQQRHYFRFGTAVPASALVDTQNPDHVRMQAVIARLFNTVTFENDLKWEALDWGQGDGGQLTTVNQAIDWCRAHEIDVRGHCLLWGSYEHLPAAVRGLRGDALLEACHNHVTDYATRMRGKVYVWDVVNEAGSNVEVWDSIGWPAFPDAFRWARAADPAVRLSYNDYAIITDDENYTKKAAARVQYLLDNHAPVDVLGVQAHMNLPLVPIPLVLERLDQWAAYGKDLEITEYDLSCPDDKIHGEYMRDLLTAAFSEPRVKSFIMWGFWEGSHWRGAEGGAMFRRDWSERPAAQAYEDLVLNQWWTRWQGATGADGRARLRAFYGRQAITVQAGGKTATTTVELTPGGAGAVELRLP